MPQVEAFEWLSRMKWVLVDAGRTDLAGLVEDAEFRAASLTPEQLRAWSYSILPHGRRGRVRLLLCRPYDARVMAMLVRVLRSVV